MTYIPYQQGQDAYIPQNGTVGGEPNPYAHVMPELPPTGNARHVVQEPGYVAQAGYHSQGYVGGSPYLGQQETVQQVFTAAGEIGAAIARGREQEFAYAQQQKVAQTAQALGLQPPSQNGTLKTILGWGIPIAVGAVAVYLWMKK